MPSEVVVPEEKFLADEDENLQQMARLCNEDLIFIHTVLVVMKKIKITQTGDMYKYLLEMLLKVQKQLTQIAAQARTVRSLKQVQSLLTPVQEIVPRLMELYVTAAKRES